MPEETVYSKLQAVRAGLAEQKLNKSGKNKFSGYSYYELSDFMKSITRLCDKNKLCTAFDFTSHFAVLRIINAEKPQEVLTFHSPMAKAEVKGCQSIQNLGAIETYERRYLYLMAFDISEPDGLEPQTGGNDKTPLPKKPEKAPASKSGPTDAQMKRLYAIAKNAGIDNAGLHDFAKKAYGKEHLNQLTTAEYDTMCKRLEKKEGK